MSRSSLIPRVATIRALLFRPWLLPDKPLVHFLAELISRAGLRKDSFGWLQATLYSQRIDQWERYASVAQGIKALDEQVTSILDVGGGQGAIKEFLSPAKYHICILDINAGTLGKPGDSRLKIVAGDGCCTPFKDNAFDMVVSVDSIEHVPDSKKGDFCLELKRVARKYVILHCPADSSDSRFRGIAYDIKFLEWYRSRFKKDEPNTAEHLRSGLPKVEQLKKLFPGAIVTGKQNTEVWLRYMRWGCTPYLRLINGLFYKLCLLKRGALPPYHASLLAWRKE